MLGLDSAGRQDSRQPGTPDADAVWLKGTVSHWDPRTWEGAVRAADGTEYKLAVGVLARSGLTTLIVGLRDARTVCAAFAAVRDGIYDTVVLGGAGISAALGNFGDIFERHDRPCWWSEKLWVPYLDDPGFWLAGCSV
jgi:hypothetical protein